AAARVSRRQEVPEPRPRGRAAGAGARHAMTELAPVTREQWLPLAAASPEATFFHTPHWARIALADPTWEDGTLGGRLADGARSRSHPLRRPPRTAHGLD